eukprot:gene12461-biopygen19953
MVFLISSAPAAPISMFTRGLVHFPTFPGAVCVGNSTSRARAALFCKTGSLRYQPRHVTVPRTQARRSGLPGSAPSMEIRARFWRRTAPVNST